MIDLVGFALGGLGAFFIMLARKRSWPSRASPVGPDDGAPRALLAIVSAITFLLVLVVAFEGVSEAPGGKLAGIARILALYLGFASGYFLHRVLALRTPRAAHRPRMPPEYEVASRRMDEVFKAMRTEAARGAPVVPDDRRFEASAKAMAEIEAMTADSAREAAKFQKQAKMLAILVIGLFVAYVVISLLNT